MTQRTVSQVQSQTQQASQQAKPWVERFARAGYMAKGIVYAIVGILAIQAAIGAGGQTTGSQGALQKIATQPFGMVMLAIVGVGLVGYSLWRFVQALVDPEDKGSDAKGIGQRLGYAVSGALYGSLAFTAFRIIMGSSSGGGSSEQAITARVLAQPFGQWLVGIGGAIIIGVGLKQIFEGITAKFREKFKLHEMSSTEQTWATHAGRFGLMARGFIFGLMGVFLIRAAYQSDPDETKSLGSALQELAQQPFGPWLLGVVAIGLIAYGIFMGVQARYRRVSP